MDTIFSDHQLMGKCIEQLVPLYQVFVDLTKVSDTVYRSTLWIILRKHTDVLLKFVEVFKQLHHNNNGVKQGDVQRPLCSPSALQLCFHMYFEIVTFGYTLTL